MVQHLVSDSKYGLSSRGHTIVVENDLSLEFEIIQNLWDPETNPDGYVSLGVAENSLMHDKLASYIEKHFTLPHIYLTYNDGGNGSRVLRNAIANFLTRRLKPVVPFKQQHIIVTNGCSSAIEHLSYLLADPGEVFLLGQPYYRAFLPDIGLRPASKVVTVPFEDVDPMGLDAVPHYEKAIQKCHAEGQVVKGLMLCHPHNPLGRNYSREVLISLMKLCQKYRIHLVSDEIYALSVWENKEDTNPPPVPFESASSIDTTDLIDPHLVHLIWGFSKDFGANGIRLGCIISQSNPDLMSALSALSLYSYPSGLADKVASTFLSDHEFTDTYFRENSEKLSNNYSLAVRYLRDHNIPYAPGANAAFFLFVDLGTPWKKARQINDNNKQEDFTQTIFDELLKNKVFLVASQMMGSEKPGWFRVVFSQPEFYLMEGLKRIVETVRGGKKTKSDLDHRLIDDLKIVDQKVDVVP